MNRSAAADRHTPVLCARIVELLTPALGGRDAAMVDGTLGMGGHTEAFLTALPGLRVIGIDRDTEALAMARERLAHFGERFVGVHAVYDEVPEILDELGLPAVQGFLFDLGVSSWQLDAAQRGFAYRMDAPLDMRMDQTSGPTAADVLNTWEAPEIARILSTYGEERFAMRIARAVVARRESQPLQTSAELVALIHDAVPAAAQHSGHPAKRTFQALRIAVNTELETWQRALPAALDRLAIDGRIAVLSYHSLEDRITKQVLSARATSTTPPGLPVELPEHAPEFRLLTRGAERADETESAANPRAIPARLRAAQRIRAPKGSRR